MIGSWLTNVAAHKKILILTRQAIAIKKQTFLPSVRRALPPVGVQSTDEQLLQTTTVCEWLKTVVLHVKRVRS